MMINKNSSPSIRILHIYLCKLICIALCIALLASLVACGGAMGGGGDGDATNDGSAAVGDGAATGGNDNGRGDGSNDNNGGNGGDGSGSNDGSGSGNAGNGNNGDGGASRDAAVPDVMGDGDISGELTISAYETMTYRSTLEAAAEAFNEKYPNVEITIDTFSAMPEFRRSESADGRSAMMSAQMEDDPQGRADYANKVNTALMSGEGADILAVDVIPIAKYVESGLLEDLSPYMTQDSDFDPSHYRQNILEAVTWKGGTWFLPMDYMFNYYTYDSTLITAEQGDFGTSSAFTTEQLLDLAKPLFDGETKILNTPAYEGRGGSLWTRLLRERWSDFVDIANKRANFKDGKFVELLNTLTSYDKDGLIPESITSQIDIEMTMDRMGQAPTDRYYFKPKTNMSLLTHFLRDSQTRFNVGISVGGASAIEDDDELAGIAANLDGSVPFTYTQAFAINSNSKNKRVAWEFIKFMLSGEMQEQGLGGMLRGLSLHNATRERQVELMLSSMAAGLRGDGAIRDGVPGSGMPGGFGRINNDAGNTAIVGPDDGGGGETASGKPGDQGGDAIVDGPGDGSGNGPGNSAGGAPGNGPGNALGNGPGDAAGDEAGDAAIGNATRSSIPLSLSDIDPEILKQYNDAVESFSNQINTFEIKDTIIEDMIQAEVAYFFEGEKTAEEVASTLQNKVELYLNE